MSSNKIIWILLSAFCGLCCVTCDLQLSEGEPCVTEGVNGTCIDIFKCNSAALIYLYREAGYEKQKMPPLPEVCSYKDNKPIICCTDCQIGKSSFKNHAVGPMGILVNTEGSVAKAKCLDYFKSLPYPCRGVGNFEVFKVWNETLQCHQVSTSIALVVGGRNAERWEFPHMALLGFGDSPDTAAWHCTGTVISERFILTAAHCSSTRTLGPIKYAALGLLKRSDPKENWKIYNVKRIITHPDYKSPIKYNDIALVETETEINFGRDLLPACLDVDGKDNSIAEAAGWGRLGHKQPLADVLQVVKLGEYNETSCAMFYKPYRLLKQGYDHQTQMCYGSYKYITDTCEGDSGGPLQTESFKCLYTVVGVTSFGKDCGVLGSPGLYTRVHHYVSWIESIVWPEDEADDLDFTFVKVN